jgi:hydroxymethylpyrimidine pyrophosphatase-like HAD family hydrolase
VSADFTGFTPKLVALDIDGTLYANVPSTGEVEEVISRW